MPLDGCVYVRSATVSGHSGPGLATSASCHEQESSGRSIGTGRAVRESPIPPPWLAPLRHVT